eukprot:TRINITY_DN12082_c0_g1_i1.p1 TRINITY_DN12082_c0_g1~~TRINITY_DN12082_c0_g1_i1.p1  ORF type:complete len:720 (+),score=122.35 TRINITY_DN12082_c0_g1_i1:59-2218(+)
MAVNITIVRGTGLKAMDFIGKSDPYVSVTLKSEFITSSNKRAHLQKIIGKTKVKRNTLEPVWNKLLTFDVTQFRQRKFFKPTKYNQADPVFINEIKCLMNSVLVFTCWDKDPIGKDLIGVAELEFCGWQPGEQVLELSNGGGEILVKFEYECTVLPKQDAHHWVFYTTIFGSKMLGAPELISLIVDFKTNGHQSKNRKYFEAVDDYINCFSDWEDDECVGYSDFFYCINNHERAEEIVAAWGDKPLSFKNEGSSYSTFSVDSFTPIKDGVFPECMYNWIDRKLKEIGDTRYIRIYFHESYQKLFSNEESAAKFFETHSPEFVEHFFLTSQIIMKDCDWTAVKNVVPDWLPSLIKYTGVNNVPKFVLEDIPEEDILEFIEDEDEKLRILYQSNENPESFLASCDQYDVVYDPYAFMQKYRSKLGELPEDLALDIITRVPENDLFSLFEQSIVKPLIAKDPRFEPKITSHDGSLVTFSLFGQDLSDEEHRNLLTARISRWFKTDDFFSILSEYLSEDDLFIIVSYYFEFLPNNAYITEELCEFWFSRAEKPGSYLETFKKKKPSGLIFYIKSTGVDVNEYRNGSGKSICWIDENTVDSRSIGTYFECGFDVLILYNELKCHPVYKKLFTSTAKEIVYEKREHNFGSDNVRVNLFRNQEEYEWYEAMNSLSREVNILIYTSLSSVDKNIVDKVFLSGIGRKLENLKHTANLNNQIHNLVALM